MSKVKGKSKRNSDSEDFPIGYLNLYRKAVDEDGELVKGAKLNCTFPLGDQRGQNKGFDSFVELAQERWTKQETDGVPESERMLTKVLVPVTFIAEVWIPEMKGISAPSDSIEETVDDLRAQVIG